MSPDPVMIIQLIVLVGQKIIQRVVLQVIKVMFLWEKFVKARANDVETM